MPQPRDSSRRRAQDERETDPRVLRFGPCAWAKLLFMRDRGETEVGGFGITAPDDLLYVEDFVTVKQETTVASIRFDDEAVADFFDAQVDAGRRPESFARIWCHTHPGNCPEPSCVDEETFARAFGACQHAVMFILARGGKSYARMRFNVGPGGDVRIPVEVDFAKAFDASDRESWEIEYHADVHPQQELPWRYAMGDELADIEFGAPDRLGAELCVDDQMLAELAEMHPDERAHILDQFGLTVDDLAYESEVYA